MEVENLTNAQIRGLTDEQLRDRKRAINSMIINIDMMIDMVEDTEGAGEQEEDDANVGYGDLDQLEEDLQDAWEQHAQVSDEQHRRVIEREDQNKRRGKGMVTGGSFIQPINAKSLPFF